MDLSKLSDEGLLRLFQALAANAKVPNAGQMAAEDTGAFQGLAIGAGKAIDDLWQGGKQVYHGAMGNDQELAALKAQQDEANRHYAPLRDSNPIGTAVGEAFPSMAAMVATGGAGSLPMALGKAALSSGAAEALKYGDVGERARRGGVAALEGGVGTLAGYGLGKLFSPVAKTPNAPSAATMGAVDRLGLELTPGQATGSIPLQKLEQTLAQRSGSAPVFAEFSDQNSRAIGRAASGAMGQAADRIDEGVFAAARQQMSAEFNRLTKGKNVKLGQRFLDDLAAVDRAHVQPLAEGFPSMASGKASEVLDDALNLASKGQMKGELYQQVRGKLGQRADDAFKGGDAQLGQALKGVIDALDDAAGQSLTKTEQAAWHQVRKQYAALKLLEKGNIVKDGKVSPQLLQNALRQKYPQVYKEGGLDGPLMDIARYAEGIRPLPDSGTAGQLAAQQAGPYSALVGSPLRYAAAQALLSKPGRAWLGSGRLDEEAMRRLMQGGGMLGPAAFGSVAGAIGQ